MHFSEKISHKNHNLNYNKITATCKTININFLPTLLMDILRKKLSDFVECSIISANFPEEKSLLSFTSIDFHPSIWNFYSVDYFEPPLGRPAPHRSIIQNFPRHRHWVFYSNGHYSKQIVRTWNQIKKFQIVFLRTYSGTPSGGSTTDNILSINLYFKIRSVTVVEVSDGDAFTSTSQGFKLLSIIIS